MRRRSRVIREDPARRGLLYAGTETGMYVSFDDGAKWDSLRLNLPVVPITDLAVHKRDSDLVVATQGRSFYVLDDLNVLHQIKDGTAKGDAYLFTPEPAYRTAGVTRSRIPAGASIGENPPNGVVLYCYLKDEPKGDTTLEFLDSSGKPLRKLTPKPKAGLNQFLWDLRLEDATTVPGMILWAGFTQGPKVAPGRYQARLTVNGKMLTQPIEIRKDPRLTDVSQEDLEKQLALSIQVRDKLSETHQAILKIRDVRKQIDEMTARLDAKERKDVIEAGKALARKLTAIEEELYQTKNQSNQDPLNYPIRLNNRLAALYGSIQSAESAPTRQAQLFYEELATAINRHTQSLRGLLDSDLSGFNKLAREKDVPPVIVRK
ncbi:MAG: hypothetical protein U0R19_18065 [Bryobacteraceae bacterium]